MFHDISISQKLLQYEEWLYKTQNIYVKILLNTFFETRIIFRIIFFPKKLNENLTDVSHTYSYTRIFIHICFNLLSLEKKVLRS